MYQAPQAQPQPPRRFTALHALLVVLVIAAIGTGVAVGMKAAGDDDGEVSASGLLTRLTTTSTSDPSSTTTVAEPVAYTAAEIARQFGPAVWRVESEGCGEIWTGTAFAIDEYHLVTNHHVVANDTTPILVSRDGTEQIDGTVIGWSIRPDVALIEVAEPLDTWLDWAPTEDLSEGEPIVVLGYPVPATDFTTTPGSVLSFQLRGERREAVRSDAAIDRGNSGGPALDSQGRVVGVVTEMAANASGFQLVPLIFTHDALRSSLRMFFAAPAEPPVDCGYDAMIPEEVEDEEPETWSSGAYDYGDHPLLDDLWDRCAAGDYQACDDLWWLAPAESVYEWFGDTCGERNEPSGWCVDVYGVAPGEPPAGP